MEILMTHWNKFTARHCYNKLLDIDATVNLIREFSETTIAIIKHACGLATRLR